MRGDKSISLGDRLMGKHQARQVDTMVVTRYTLDAWRKTQQYGTEENWKDAMMPDSVIGFVAGIRDYCEECQKVVATRYKIGVLDEEYFAWLEANGKKDVEKARTEYAVQLTEEKAMELLRKNGLDVQYSVCGIPFVLTRKKAFYGRSSGFILDEKTAEQLKLYLESIYGSGSIYVPGYIMHPDVLCEADKSGRMVDMSKSWYEDGARVRLGAWDRQEYVYHDEDAPSDRFSVVSRFYIPFVVKSALSEPYVNLGEELTTNEVALFPESVVMLRYCLKNIGINGVPDIQNSRFARMLRQYFRKDGDVYLEPCAVLGYTAIEDDETYWKEIFSKIAPELDGAGSPEHSE